MISDMAAIADQSRLEFRTAYDLSIYSNGRTEEVSERQARASVIC